MVTRYYEHTRDYFVLEKDGKYFNTMENFGKDHNPIGEFKYVFEWTSKEQVDGFIHARPYFKDWTIWTVHQTIKTNTEFTVAK